MKRQITFPALCVLLFALCSPAEAQQSTKIPRIGYLVGNSLSSQAARIEAFRQGLRDLGYIEGKNIAIEWQSADGQFDGLPRLAAELVRLKVAVIVTGGPQATRAAKEATSTIPIVMANVGDPVGDGLVASLARPGENITGLSALAPELSGKRLEILTEVVPKLSRVAVLGTATNPGIAQQLRELEPAAKALKVQLQYLDVLAPKDIETAFRAASKGRADAVITLGGGILVSQRAQI
jgi:putative tryptophan/tyrosine transport system substrate-binding protein